MSKESIFSPEYDIDNATESQSSIKEKISVLEDDKKDDILKKIESDYNLSKPRRNIIRARIIPR